ncbi:MAG: ATP-dependent zinc metalloprotease FtsH [Thermogemmata sp.]|uniref:ATP-dependent zinc metalloprotease FtsH n=1 Tax=Thermogemmata fonticola TaxID=2755323 RepID=A0A7V8VB50_9BACT|nr:ATP-dependent zinc metalloprotease FtsH [Thermogemmata fonticola]MBA2224786.1 ATP-dependent metallopeptidase FtsH/Yme1/Tma family protein [Thermogemmata fonticola]MCX8140210.1 ATP-dependent zinc metalloprotease FtsH [Gemmataceae bacterium]
MTPPAGNSSPRQSPSASPPPQDNQTPSPKRAHPLLPSSWILLVVLGVISIVYLTASGGREITYSDFHKLIAAGEVQRVTFIGQDYLEGEVRDPHSALAKQLRLPSSGHFSVNLPTTLDQTALVREWEEKDRQYREMLQKTAPERVPEPLVISKRGDLSWLGPFLLNLLLIGLVVGIFLFVFVPRLRDPLSGGFLTSYTRSPAKRYEKGKDRVSFDDVAGMENAKRELWEIVEYLRDPGKFARLGARVPKGVLLFGPPGTGKTLLAKAVAGEANVPFFSISGSEFIQMFVGVGASRVRDMFRVAKENAPCVVFIDEIDAVGRMRGTGYGGGSDEREQTLNQILSEMDGFQPSETVIVIAATNRPDVLDPALLRPGRFDRHITVDRPTWRGRLEILKVHTRNKPLADDVDLERIARSMVGMSGAELQNLCNEAALHATRRGSQRIEQIDFDRAADRVRLGVPRDEALSEQERRRTAYHEAGHALCALLQPKADKIDRVSIIPRGQAGGVTLLQPDEEKMDRSASELMARLVVALGGRAADKLIFGEPMAGAVMDLKQATRLARIMVTQYGMSARLGPVYYQIGEEHVFLGKEIIESRTFSEGTARLIDEEIQRLLTEAEEQASALLRAHRDALERIAEALLLHEELDVQEVERLVAGASAQDIRPDKTEPQATTSTKPLSTPAEAVPVPPPPPGLAFGSA